MRDLETIQSYNNKTYVSSSKSLLNIKLIIIFEIFLDTRIRNYKNFRKVY